MSFFERTYSMLKEFCDNSDGSISVILVCDCIQQLVDNKSRPIPIHLPENFISAEKLCIWKTLKHKLKELELDGSVNTNIDILWTDWSRLLFEKESKVEELSYRESHISSFLLSPVSVTSPCSVSFNTPQTTPSSSNLFSKDSTEEELTESDSRIYSFSLSPFTMTGPASFTSPQTTPSSSNFPGPSPSLYSSNFVDKESKEEETTESDIYSLLLSPSSSSYMSPQNTPSSSSFPSPHPSPRYFPSPSPSPRSAYLSSPSPSAFYTASPNQTNPKQEADTILEPVSIRVMTTEDHHCGYFNYAKKANEKFVCQTDGCKISMKKQSKIKNEGVTRETLIAHAVKCHSIHLNLKKKIGILQEGFTCTHCSKSFSRRQTLVKHKEKYHGTPAQAPPQQVSQVEMSTVAPVSKEYTVPLQQETAQEQPNDKLSSCCNPTIDLPTSQDLTYLPPPETETEAEKELNKKILQTYDSLLKYLQNQQNLRKQS